MNGKVRRYLWFLIAVIFCSFGLFSILYFGGLVSFSKKDNSDLTPVKLDVPVPQRLESSASLIMVGDSLIHGAVYQNAYIGDNKYDFKPMMDRIKPIVSSYDLRYYNQETILGGTELGLSSYPRFNSPYEVGDAFLDMGFNLVSLATNHTMDKGEQGVLNSLAYWKDKDVLAAGSYNSFEDRDTPIVRSVNGIRYTLLSYTVWNNGLKTPSGKEYLNNEYSEELVRADVERVRGMVDVILVAMHWGTEYSFGVSNQQREIASYLASLGVDIIIGSHPHVVEPIEFIGKTMVIYSLGNFISAQIGVGRLSGLMASVTIKKTVSNGNVQIELVEPKAELIYTYYSSRITDFKVYPYRELNEVLLPGYRGYYEELMNIVVPEGSRVLKVGLD